MDVDSFELKCKVRAYPQIIMETIEWSFGPEGNKTYMLKDDNVEGYETYATVRNNFILLWQYILYHYPFIIKITSMKTNLLRIL